MKTNITMSELLDIWGDIWCAKHQVKRNGPVYYRGDWPGKSKSGRSNKEKHKLAIETEDCIFEEEDFKPIGKPIIVFKKETEKTNNSDRDISVTINFEKEYISSAEVELATGLNLGTECQISFGIPSITEASVSLAVSGSVENRRKTVKGTTMRFGESDQITCPPGKKVIISGQIEKRSKRINYTTPVKLSGTVVLVCHKNKRLEHSRQHVLIQEVFNDLFIAAEDDDKLAKRLKHFELSGDHVNFALHGSVTTHTYHSSIDCHSVAINSTVNQQELDSDRSVLKNGLDYQTARASARNSHASITIFTTTADRTHQRELLKVAGDRPVTIDSSVSTGPDSSSSVVKMDASAPLGEAQERLAKCAISRAQPKGSESCRGKGNRASVNTPLK